MIFLHKLFFRYFFILLFFSSLFGNEDKSSREIQKDIDTSNRELQNLRNEIKDIEERLIVKNKEATANTEVLIDLTNKISLTEKLIRSLGKEEKNISSIIHGIDVQIIDMEGRLTKLKNQLTKRLQYLYIHGRPSTLETILLSKNWNSAIYRIKYLDVLASHEKKLRQQMSETVNSLEVKKTMI